MKKDTLLLLLINILDNMNSYCDCEPAKENLQFIIKKLQKEGVEDD